MNLTSLIWGAALRGAILLAIAGIAAHLLRRASADLRHRIWAAALVGMALRLVPIQRAEELRISVAAASFVNGPATGAGSTPWQVWALWIWGAGAVMIALKTGVGVLRLWWLTRRARQESENIYISNATATPLTWGAFRPVILLPEYASRWTPDELGRAMSHEEAHIARRDWAWQMFAQAMTAIFWFHPLVWLAASRLRREADLAADNAVMDAGADAATYAAQLLEVARMFQGPRYATGVNMVRTPAIEGRIQSILNPALRRKPAGLVARLAIAIGTVALLAPLAAFQSEQLHKLDEPGIKGPRIVTRVDPQYTEQAKADRIEGTVTLRAVIGTNGQAHDIVVLKPLYPGLDENAMAALTRWVFTPAEKDGKPVAVSVMLEVNFHFK